MYLREQQRWQSTMYLGTQQSRILFILSPPEDGNGTHFPNTVRQNKTKTKDKVQK